jgi:hypothetical protein
MDPTMDHTMDHVCVATTAALVVLPAAALYLLAAVVLRPSSRTVNPLPPLPLPLLPLLLLSMLCLVRASVPGTEAFAVSSGAQQQLVTCGNASAVNNLASLPGRPRAIWPGQALVPSASKYTASPAKVGTLQQCIDWGRQDGFTAGNWDCSPTVAAGGSRCVKYKLYATGDTGVPPATSYRLSPKRNSTGFISTRGKVCIQLTTKTNLCDYVNMVSGGVDLIKDEKTCLSCKDNIGFGYIWMNGRCMARPLTNAELTKNRWKGPIYTAPMGVVLPPSLSLRDKMFRVRNQFAQGACFAYTSSAVMEYHAIRVYNIDYRLSPQWIYDMRTRGRSGMSIGDVKSILGANGVAADIFDPAFAVGLEDVVGIGLYSETKISTGPGPTDPIISWVDAAEANAASFKIDAKIGVQLLISVNDVKSALASVGPVIIGITSYNPAVSQPWKPAATPPEAASGGHAMVIDSYDDADIAPGSGTPGCFGVRNSWGGYWGKGGFTKMSYADYERYVEEAWLLTPNFSLNLSSPSSAVIPNPPLLTPWLGIEPSDTLWSNAGSKWAPTDPTPPTPTTAMTPPLPPPPTPTPAQMKSSAMRALLKIGCESDFVSYNTATNQYVMGKIPSDVAVGAAFKPSGTPQKPGVWITAMAVNLADLSRMPLIAPFIRGNVLDRP